MTEVTNNMISLIASCWKNDTLKQRFLSDPHTVLAEHGMDVPEGLNVNVVENTDSTVHITLPTAPTGLETLSDDELQSAAGGTIFTIVDATLNIGAVSDEEQAEEVAADNQDEYGLDNLHGT